MKEIKAVSRPGLTSYQTVSVARKRVTPGTYLIRRHGLWFRAEANGYSPNLSEAGTFDAAAARDYLCVEGLSVVPIGSLRGKIEMEISGLQERIVALGGLLKKDHQAKPEEEE